MSQFRVGQTQIHGTLPQGRGLITDLLDNKARVNNLNSLSDPETSEFRKTS